MIEHCYDNWLIQQSAYSGEIPPGTLLQRDSSMFSEGVKPSDITHAGQTDPLFVAGEPMGTLGPTEYYVFGDHIYVHPIQLGEVLWIPRVLIRQYLNLDEIQLIHSHQSSWIAVVYHGVVYADFSEFAYRITPTHHFTIWDEWDFQTPEWMQRYLDGEENPQVGGILL